MEENSAITSKNYLSLSILGNVYVGQCKVFDRSTVNIFVAGRRRKFSEQLRLRKIIAFNGGHFRNRLGERINDGSGAIEVVVLQRLEDLPHTVGV